MSNTKREDVAYHNLTDERLKELLALHGITTWNDPGTGRLAQWMPVYQGGAHLSWPLSVELEIRTGKILVGEIIYDGPCTVRIHSVQHFHIIEPLIAEGTFSMRFTERVK